VSESQRALLLMIAAGAILAVAAGVPALLLYWRGRATSLTPPPAPWLVPWNGVAILLAFVFSLFLQAAAQSVVPAALGDAGFFTMRYGPDFPTRLRPDVDKQSAHLLMLWSQAFAVPIMIAAIVVVFPLATGASLRQIGLTRERGAKNLVFGYLVWLGLTPIVFAVFLVAALITETEKHPLTDLGPHVRALEFIVFVVEVGLLAPLSEELLFRGLLLPWLAQPASSGAADPPLLSPSQRSDLTYAMALFFPMAMLLGRERFPIESFPPKATIFLAALLPLYLVLPRSARVGRWIAVSSEEQRRGIFASSALFAGFHSTWPTPVPLFVLALGLAWVTLRTRSIVPSITVHALFNGISVIYLALGGTS
jgi:membrane protease YdiL (CAAX protease family)